MAYYFAYGNNMRAGTMAERCGPPGPDTWQDAGIARLRGYRLAFTVSTPNWNGPVGDIERVESQTDFCVYGFLYRVNEAALAALDSAEYAVGHSTYYARRTMEVERVDVQDLLATPEIVEAQVYYAGQDYRHEDRPPADAYLLRLLEAARERQLPEEYIRALRSLEKRSSQRAERNLLVLPTKDRGGGHELPIVQVAPGLRRRLDLDRLGFAVFEDRACLVAIAERADLEGRGLVCGVDETARRGLGVPAVEPGMQFFGARVELRPARRHLHRQWLPARHLLLHVEKVEYLDAERGIAVVPETILRMLGLDHGDYLTIEVAHPDADSAHVAVRRLRRRAFTGSTRRRRVGRKSHPYPEDGRLHLDLDGRQALGFTGPFKPLYPAIVSASTRHLLLKRFLFYGLALVGVSVGLAETIMPPLLAKLHGGPVSALVSFGAAFGTAVLLGTIAVWVDVSQRLRP